MRKIRCGWRRNSDFFINVLLYNLFMGYSDKGINKYYKHEHYLDNKDEYYWRTALWRANNPEKIKAIRRAYYDRTKQFETARKRKWAKNNPEKAKAADKRQWNKKKDFRNCVRRLQYKLDKCELI